MVEPVTVKELVKANPTLKVIEGENFLDQRVISVSDISRPGLELTGYFDFYPKERIQLLGRTEISYSKNLNHEARQKVFKRMATPETPCFVIARDLSVPQELIEACNQAKIPVLQSKLATTRLSSLLTDYLDEKLAPRKSMHGVLVEIYGMGVMIIGNSGVGKSETALDLIKRGHRLIADDRVDVFQKDEKTVVGEAPKILKHLMEIRGIGIIDVMNLFGAGSVRDQSEIQLIIKLENWNPDSNYERLGLNENKKELVGVSVPQITIPVKVGRNIAIIIEVAAMNFRAKRMGYDASKKFKENLAELISDNSKEEK
ncbi:HPr(Ser) kinase/phosphatase [Lactobacillus rodentium]|uniref:HPr kinase/phosphorylase n=1 Tax=Lactobacillus rodentium TaxID=947835 RepID=A0A2Z6TGC1_9LACO|nr:HPr(Ser) kinase/phosphatase [Lactobacillus rodentium]MCR1895073.1 HPr(Ser) kinase/phosphatase [Lactobacillus rodentium]GBG05390.1 HPr kinase/phosphorylase [Lactobacillus rodentium]